VNPLSLSPEGSDPHTCGIGVKMARRTCYEKSVHKAIQNVTSNNDKLRKIGIMRLNNISNSKFMGVRMQRINVSDIIKSKQMKIE